MDIDDLFDDNAGKPSPEKQVDIVNKKLANTMLSDILEQSAEKDEYWGHLDAKPKSMQTS